MSHPTAAELAAVDLFGELDERQLEIWAQAATIEEVPEGAIVAEQGADSPGLTIILDGTIEALAVDGEQIERVGDHIAPTWMGAIATLTDGPVGVRMRAGTPLRLATVPPEDFVELAIEHRCVFRRVMNQVRPVVERISAIGQNRERLESLGTMAAGLAHELNNPAAAAKRTSFELGEALEVIGSTIGVFVESGVERSEAEALVMMQREALASCARADGRGALEAADAEDALSDVLEELGIEDAYKLVEPLVRANVDEAFLRRVQELAGTATAAAVRWIAASLLARVLAGELAESTEQMSRLVGAVKRYAYMDHGGQSDVDIHEDLETTLTILGYKLKHTSIVLERRFDPAVPRITAFGAELNQVWTNILDNAIDALGETGTITISTRRDGTCIEVDIADDGPGVPEQIRERIFDPFFTTKEVGRGTGLGLDTARRIVVDRHRGSLTLVAPPGGGTLFRVRLPIEQPSTAA
jgi:signal transduction histidine kinase